jgi:hypothetical protein
MVMDKNCTAPFGRRVRSSESRTALYAALCFQSQEHRQEADLVCQGRNQKNGGTYRKPVKVKDIDVVVETECVE